jgi:hypothetical protein
MAKFRKKKFLVTNYLVAFFNKIVKSLGRVTPDFYLYLKNKNWPSDENLPQKEG